MKTGTIWLVVVCLLGLGPTAVSGQTAQVGQVIGTVADATGGVLPGATVQLRSIERGFSRSTVTDAEGRFSFRQVTLGAYDIDVSLAGFQTRTVTNNLVEAEKTTAVPIVLALTTVGETTTVVGEVPIVDAQNQTQMARLRADEFQRLPMARSYQQLMGQAPGVVGTGNVNAHGALTASNQFMADGINTTDTVTGTFGNNMNYEAIAEVVVRTAGVSAEFGRSTGAYVDVITKSGTNRFSGSFKFIGTNDAWDEQNGTTNEVTGASLARDKYDKVNKVYSFTVGGPILRDRAWFFVAFEDSRSTTPETQLNPRPGTVPETFQQVRKIQYPNYRGTVQLSQGQSLWVKYASDPFTGIVRNDYWAPFIPAERASLTSQEQGGYSVSGQYTAVIGSRWTTEATMGYATNRITVEPFERTQVDNGAPYIDLNDNRVYNGATFDGYVKRPRLQVGLAATYFANWGGRDHQIKAGVDLQSLKSENAFRFPNNQLFYGYDYDPASRTFAENDSREDYDDAPSDSKGDLLSFYVRDRIQVNTRTSLEVGLRVERQTGTSDVGVRTVNTTNVAPRLSVSYALTNDSKTLLLASYGRFYDGILQSYSDEFANVPQQTNYNTYIWDGSQYVFSSRSEASANTFSPDEDVDPRHMDEFTVGAERQIGRSLGGSIRYIHRNWGNFLDDVQSINPDGTLNRTVANIDSGRRTYRGLELQVEKRLSNRWSGMLNYTYSQTRGNHVDTGDNFTLLEDFVDETCRQTVDPGLFGGGTFPCSELQANLYGRPSFDRPHLLKYSASYLQSLGPVDLTFGMVGQATSKMTYQRARTIQVLSPVTGQQFSTMAYWYDPRGSERIPGLLNITDVNVVASWRGPSTTSVGIQFETFNLFNNEEKINVSNTTWCDSTATAACATAVDNFGTATTRAAFQAARTYRVSLVFRY